MIETGEQVQDAASSNIVMACIGLKLKLPDGKVENAGQDILTTVTRGFVKEPLIVQLENRMGYWVNKYYLEMRYSMHRLLRPLTGGSASLRAKQINLLEVLRIVTERKNAKK